MAAKLLPCFHAPRARDLYDIHNMIYYGLFDNCERDMLRKCVLFYFVAGAREIPEAFNFSNIDGITALKIRTDLLPVIRRKERFDLTAVQARVKAYLSELLVPTDNEREFIFQFRTKNYCPELLFDHPEIIERLRNHPMILWKLRDTAEPE